MTKQKLFGGEYEIVYDTISDHDTYRHLRVSLEVERGVTDRCTVLLNGSTIGFIVAYRSTKHTTEYRGHRYIVASPTIPNTTDDAKLSVPIGAERVFTSIGICVAAIISNFI